MLFKETKAIQIPGKVQELPEEGEFWMEEKYCTADLHREAGVDGSSKE